MAPRPALTPSPTETAEHDAAFDLSDMDLSEMDLGGVDVNSADGIVAEDEDSDPPSTELGSVRAEVTEQDIQKRRGRPPGSGSKARASVAPASEAPKPSLPTQPAPPAPGNQHPANTADLDKLLQDGLAESKRQAEAQAKIFNGIQDSITSLGKVVTGLRGVMDSNGDSVTRLSERVEKIEASLDAILAAVQQVHKTVDSLQGNLETLRKAPSAPSQPPAPSQPYPAQPAATTAQAEAKERKYSEAITPALAHQIKTVISKQAKPVAVASVSSYMSGHLISKGLKITPDDIEEFLRAEDLVNENGMVVPLRYH